MGMPLTSSSGRSRSQRKPSSRTRTEPVELAGHQEQGLLQRTDPSASSEENIKQIAVNLRLKGRSLAQVADRTGLSEREVHKAELEYYESQESLSEHAMLLKQLARLDHLLSLLWDRVETQFVENPDEYRNILEVIKEISELAGLRKQRLQAEVQVIQNDQVPLIKAYVAGVMNAYEKQLLPLMTKKGVAQLESHREEWLSEAASEGVSSLTEKTVPLKM